MTSACNFKAILRNDTQVFLKFRNSNLEICLHLIKSNCTLNFLPSSVKSSGTGTSKKSHFKKVDYHYPQSWSLFHFHLLKSAASSRNYSTHSSQPNISSNISIDSMDSDVFYVEEISDEPSPQRNNSPDILNSTELSELHPARMPSISKITSPEPYIFTINDNSNEPTMPYGFAGQLPIVPRRLNDLNLPPHPFKNLATMAVANNTEDANDDNDSPQSPEPSEPSPKSTPPKLKRRLCLGRSFPKEGAVSQHVCEAGGQTIPSTKDIPGPSNRS